MNVQPDTIVPVGARVAGFRLPIAGRFWRRSGSVALLRLLAAAGFFGLWQAASQFGLVDPFFFSSPIEIVGKFFEMVGNGSLWPHVKASGLVVALGFLAALVVGIPSGLLMGRVRLLRETLEPFLAALYASPTVAFLPLVIIWFGIGIVSKVALVFVGCVVIIIVSTEAGVAQVDARLIEAGRAFMARELQILRWIILPAGLPFIVAGMRLALGRALLMVVVAEIYASNVGLGYLIFQAGGTFDTAKVFVGVGVLAAAGVAMNAALRLLERRLAPWRTNSA